MVRKTRLDVRAPTGLGLYDGSHASAPLRSNASSVDIDFAVRQESFPQKPDSATDLLGCQPTVIRPPNAFQAVPSPSSNMVGSARGRNVCFIVDRVHRTHTASQPEQVKDVTPMVRIGKMNE